MRPNSPRIPLITPDKFTQDQAALAEGWSDYNFTRMLVNHPPLYRAFQPFGGWLMAESTLPARDREILILRTVGLCSESYEAAHHVVLGREVGLTAAEVEAARAGGADLDPFGQALVKAAEELVHHHCLSDETWAELAQRYSPPEMMEVVFMVGNYTMMAMVTNSLGIADEAASASI